MIRLLINHPDVDIKFINSSSNAGNKITDVHEGQEFNLVIEGRMLLNINGKELILNPGDSLYFDSSIPHGICLLYTS